MSRAWWVGVCSAALLCASLSPRAAVGQAAAASTEAADRQFATAVGLQNRDQYDLAADEWGQFIKKFPSDPRAGFARCYLGLCQVKGEQFAAASQTFAALLADI